MKFSSWEKASFLRDGVFAANDGIITTFAVVAGSYGASFSSSIVLILGFANLFADGLSMASGNYLGVKSEIDYNKKRTENKDMLHHDAYLHGLITFISFVIAGLLPLLPYLFGIPNTFYYSAVTVFVSLFVVGSVRTLFTGKNALRGGLEMTLVGGFAAIVAYTVGHLLKGYVTV